jgi:hypothetical protein
MRQDSAEAFQPWSISRAGLVFSALHARSFRTQVPQDTQTGFELCDYSLLTSSNRLSGKLVVRVAVPFLLVTAPRSLSLA